MIFEKTPLTDCWTIQPQIHGDHRGSFMESFKKELFEQTVGPISFIQENEAVSTYGVIRGLHFQKEPYAQSKLVRVVQGSIVDIVLDLRKDSPTHQKSFRIELSAENKKQLFVPKGFAHGYGVISPSAVVIYKVDAPYKKEAESGISPLESTYLFDWGVAQEDQKINERDLNW